MLRMGSPSVYTSLLSSYPSGSSRFMDDGSACLLLLGRTDAGLGICPHHGLDDLRAPVPRLLLLRLPHVRFDRRVRSRLLARLASSSREAWPVDAKLDGDRMLCPHNGFGHIVSSRLASARQIRAWNGFARLLTLMMPARQLLVGLLHRRRGGCHIPRGHVSEG